jgi:hypothetical protein
MWRDNISGDLRFTTFDSTERDSYTIEGSVYYFANASQTSSSVMYRLYSNPDHMDSNVAGEGGYTTQEVLPVS